VYDAFIALEAQCAEGHGPDDALVRDARMATTFVNQEGGDIVREAYLLAGSSALRDGPLQRAFRDIHAGTQHAVVSESVTLDYGTAAMTAALGATEGP
jgi:alkylation response protein AidB-like acyl-CoA dehydrogenase